jgi:hypothetical protein
MIGIAVWMIQFGMILLAMSLGLGIIYSLCRDRREKLDRGGSNETTSNN